MHPFIKMGLAFLLGLFAVAQPVQNEARTLRHVSASKTHTRKARKKHGVKALCTARLPERDACSGDQKKIAEFILVVQPRKGAQYADRVARLIVRESNRYHLDPCVVATTAYIESEFSMVSRPCMGIMQVQRQTFNEDYKSTGLNPRNIGDNIHIGALMLVDKSRTRLASRGGYDRQLAATWGRYNGSTSHGSYVRHAFLVMSRLRHGNPKTWKAQIEKRGALWK